MIPFTWLAVVLAGCSALAVRPAGHYNPGVIGEPGVIGLPHSLRYSILRPRAAEQDKYPRRPGLSAEGKLTLGSEQLHLGIVVSRPFDENSYIAHLHDRGDCVVFDPGLEPLAIEEYLTEHALTPAALVCTHGHSDHIAGNRALKSRWPECPIIIGAGDAEKLVDSELNLSAPFGFPITSLPADRTVLEGDQISAAGLEFEVFETPGHSVGHVVFLCKQVQPWRLFGGDVLFQGSIGRTDFPDGSFDALRRAIQEKLFTLPDDTIVYPGHGPETTIGREKRINPFVGEPAGYIA